MEMEMETEKDVEVKETEEEEEELYLDIPVRTADGEEGEEVIQIPISSLPAIEDLLNVLRAESAELWRWLQFAYEYYRQGRILDFEHILVEASSRESQEYYRDDRKGRVAILNAYAAHKIEHARLERIREDRAKRIAIEKHPNERDRRDLASERASQKHLEEAKVALRQANAIEKSETTLVNEGLALMVEQSEEAAQAKFGEALAINPSNLQALLGMGQILYAQGAYKDALERYRNAILYHPGCSASVRTWLGLCFYSLGKENRARECFERALDLDPNEKDALVSLAVLDLGIAAELAQDYDDDEEDENEKEQKKSTSQMKAALEQKALERLNKAYTLDKSDGMALNHLANHFFKQKGRDNDQIQSLATKAIKNSENNKVRAEAWYILAKLFHDKGEYEEAKQFYEKSLDSWPTFELAKYGRAQMELCEKRPDYGKIIKLLSGFHDTDSLFLLGHAQVMSRKIKEATETLKKVTDINPDLADAWIEQARNHHRLQGHELSAGSKEAALRCYRKALAALRRNNQVPKLEHLANMGILKCSLKDYNGAEEDTKEALELWQLDQKQLEREVAELRSSVDGGNTNDIQSLKEKLEQLETHRIKKCTLTYNMAYIKQLQGEIDEAEEMYKQLIKECKEYAPAYLALASLSRDRQQFDDADEWLQQAQQNNPSHTNTILMQAKLKLEQGQIQVAKRKFDKILGSKSKHGDKASKKSKMDVYCRLGEAAVRFIQAQKLDKRSAKRDKEIFDVLKLYRVILHDNPKNIYAANGVGAALFELGRYDEARKILESVREVSDASNPQVWINLGHVTFAREEYDRAAKLYEQCLKRMFDNQNTGLMASLGHAYTRAGKFDQAQSMLWRALHRDPSDLRNWFNAAAVEVNRCIQLYVDVKRRIKKGELRDIQSLRTHVFLATNAASVLEWVSSEKTHAAKRKPATINQVIQASQEDGLYHMPPHSPRTDPPEDQDVEVELAKQARITTKLFFPDRNFPDDDDDDDEQQQGEMKANEQSESKTTPGPSSSRRSLEESAPRAPNFKMPKTINESKRASVSIVALLNTLITIADQKKKEQEQQKTESLRIGIEKARKREAELKEKQQEEHRKQQEIRQRAEALHKINLTIASTLDEQQRTAKEAEKEKKSKKKKQKDDTEKFIDDEGDGGESDSSSSSSSSGSSSSSASSGESKAGKVDDSKSTKKMKKKPAANVVATNVKKKKKLVKRNSSSSLSSASSDSSDDELLNANKRNVEDQNGDQQPPIKKIKLNMNENKVISDDDDDDDDDDDIFSLAKAKAQTMSSASEEKQADPLEF